MKLTRRTNDDAGFALPTVLAIVLVMSLAISASLALASTSYKQAGKTSDWNAALSAAQAGVDDYLARLNRDNGYYQYGDPADPYTHNAAAPLPPASDPNAAFTTWVDVPTVDGGGRASYRYEVNSSTFPVDGNIKVRATGRAGQTTRTVETTIRRQNFLDFLYYTDYETKDPSAYSSVAGDALTQQQAQDNCIQYYPARSPSLGCTDIEFGDDDVINGPVHTNDAFMTCGDTHFNGPVSTDYKGASVNYRVDTTYCSGHARFSHAGDPSCCTILSMPPSNSAIKAQVDPTQVTVPGCLYAGPTTITFNGDGTFNVSSPFTRDTSRCAVGNNVSMPAGSTGVIYVEAVPSSPDDPNYWSPTDPSYPACRASGNPVGYPVAGDITTYGCTDGDVFVKGVVKGGVTIAAEKDIVIVGDLTDKSTATSSKDILGLVADGNVEVYHPVSDDLNCTTSHHHTTCTHNYSNMSVGWGTNGDPDIDAAILSVKHSFTVQNYWLGSCLGTFNVYGALAQEFRGIVAIGGSSCSHGYIKSYSYDNRLKTLEPPHFLDPVQSAFKVQTWAEPAAAYAWNAS